jgi:hypothetical protein
VLRTLSAYSGGGDLDLYMRVNGTIPEGTPRVLDPKYAHYGASPPPIGTINVGSGGYWVPSIEKQWELLLAAAQKKSDEVDAERNKGKPAANTPPWRP